MALTAAAPQAAQLPWPVPSLIAEGFFAESMLQNKHQLPLVPAERETKVYFLSLRSSADTVFTRISSKGTNNGANCAIFTVFLLSFPSAAQNPFCSKEKATTQDSLYINRAVQCQMSKSRDEFHNWMPSLSAVSVGGGKLFSLCKRCCCWEFIYKHFVPRNKKLLLERTVTVL